MGGPDPWRHRSQGMRCATCMWYVPKVPPVLVIKGMDPDDLTEFPIAPGRVIRQDEAARVREIPGSPLGRCRKHAPTMNGYPVVFETDWCGDHKLDEEKYVRPDPAAKQQPA